MERTTPKRTPLSFERRLVEVSEWCCERGLCVVIPLRGRVYFREKKESDT